MAFLSAKKADRKQCFDIFDDALRSQSRCVFFRACLLDNNKNRQKFIVPLTATIARGTIMMMVNYWLKNKTFVVVIKANESPTKARGPINDEKPHTTKRPFLFILGFFI